MLRRTIFVIVLCIAFIALGVMGFKQLAGMAKDSKRSSTPPEPAMVRSMKVERRTYAETLRGYGRARALRRTTVSADVGGYVESVDARLEVGTPISFVAKPRPSAKDGKPSERDESGPVVIRIESVELHDLHKRALAEVQASKAEDQRLKAAAVKLEERHELAEADLATARRERDRVARLVREGGRFSKSQLDAEELKVSLQRRALLQLETEQTDNANQQKVLAERLVAREADASIAARNLRRAKIRVPFPGVVESRSVNAGDRVGPGQALFAMIDLSAVEVPVALPARYFADVDAGSAVTLYYAESGRKAHTGTVSRKSPGVNEAERVFYAFVVIKGTPVSNPVAPGEYLRAEVAGRTHENVYVIPREAFASEDLFALDADAESTAGQAAGAARRAIARRITPTVSRWLMDVAVVTGGLADGDEIATTNLESVANGSKLRVAPPIETPGGTSGQ